MRELIHSTRHEETLKSEYAAFPQRTKFARVSAHHPAPVPRVDPEFSRRGSELFAICSSRRRRGNTIQWHFNQRRNSASRRSASRRRKTLPFGAARLVDMYVSVDQPRHHDGITHVVKCDAGWNILVRSDGCNAASTNVNRGWAFTARCHYSMPTNDEIRRVCKIYRLG